MGLESDGKGKLHSLLPSPSILSAVTDKISHAWPIKQTGLEIRAGRQEKLSF